MYTNTGRKKQGLGEAVALGQERRKPGCRAAQRAGRQRD